MERTVVTLLLALVFVTSTFGLSIYKSPDTKKGWEERGEVPVVDALVATDGMVAPNWGTLSVTPATTWVVSFNNMLYTFFSPPVQSVSSDMFVEDGSSTTFVVNTRAAFNLEEITVSEQAEQAMESDIDSGSALELTASYNPDNARKNVNWLTVSYTCKRPSLSLVSVRLRMYDFDENPRDVSFSWQKSCGEDDVQVAEKKQGWLAKLSDLDPTKPFFAVFESDSDESNPPRTSEASSGGTSFLITTIALILCAAGAATLVVAVIMDAFEAWFLSSPSSDQQEEEEAGLAIPVEEEESGKAPMVPETVPPPPFPIFSTHLVQPEPYAVMTPPPLPQEKTN